MASSVKQKSHSGARKRFKMNKNGVITGARPFRRKFLTKKSAARKRRLRKDLHIADCDINHLRVLL